MHIVDSLHRRAMYSPDQRAIVDACNDPRWWETVRAYSLLRTEAAVR